MSRSAFAARFRELLGQPVMAYLTEVRMQLAVDLLHRSDRTVAEVATAVGYESDASFSRVFKRHLGTSPRRLRQASLTVRGQRSIRSAIIRDFRSRRPEAKRLWAACRLTPRRRGDLFPRRAAARAAVTLDSAKSAAN